ncbi:MAG: MarR family winged helix-turn-helix transcriptional regulator [Candidatus Gracilibacteria bacterium]
MQRTEIIQDFFSNLNTMKRLLMKQHGDSHIANLPTHAQMGILMTVSKRKNTSIKDLAQEFGISSSAITQIVDLLVRDGHLRRKEDPLDRRKLSVSLTAKGKKIMEEAKKMRMAFLSNMLEILSEEELLQLKNIQQKIIEHLPSHENNTPKETRS